MKSLQALFGGTFDPVHYGHLNPVETLANLIGLTRVTIIPNNAPSYTAQTLKEWRQEQWPDVPLAFIIGQDSLLTFPTWYEYETILDNAHLIVCRRPGYPLEMAQPQYQQWLEDHLTHNPEDLHLQPAGKIYLAETPWFNISATIIRERLQNGESCEDLLPEPVLTYINQQGLYR